MTKLKSIYIKSNITIKAALKQMDIAAEKMLIVIDQNSKLQGVITDGDIRRWLLKEGALDEIVEKVMNKNPIFVNEEYDKNQVKKIMLENKIECIPIINKEKKVISAIFWFDIFQTKAPIYNKINIPVVIMAGGTGTRLQPFTKILPKPLLPIGEKPIIEMIIDEFVEFGCNEYYLSVNYKANMIKAYFNDLQPSYKLNYIEEKKPLGTAGSLYLLKNKIKKSVFISNCDILIKADYSDILKFHKDNKNKITIVSSLKHYLIPYGIVEMSLGGVLKEIKEKPEYDFLVNTGMYILEPEVLNHIPNNTFFSMPDLINFYLKNNKKVGVYPISDKSWTDIGQIEELQDVLNKLEVK